MSDQKLPVNTASRGSSQNLAEGGTATAGGATVHVGAKDSGNHEAMLTFALAIPAVVRFWVGLGVLLVLLAMAGITTAVWIKLERMENTINNTYKRATDMRKLAAKLEDAPGVPGNPRESQTADGD